MSSSAKVDHAIRRSFGRCLDDTKSTTEATTTATLNAPRSRVNDIATHEGYLIARTTC